MPTRSFSSRRCPSRLFRRCCPPWSAKGFIGWDDRAVIDHDPAFRLSDPFVTREVTLRDLLCHRSGLPDHAGDLLEDLGLRSGPKSFAGCGFRETGEQLSLAIHVHELRLHGSGQVAGSAERRPGRPGRTSPPTSWPSAPWARRPRRVFASRTTRGLGTARGTAHVRARRHRGPLAGARASPTPSPRPAEPVRRHATCRCGCACISAAASLKASRSSRPRPWRRRAGPRSSATRRPTGPASTGLAGT